MIVCVRVPEERSVPLIECTSLSLLISKFGLNFFSLIGFSFSISSECLGCVRVPEKRSVPLIEFMSLSRLVVIFRCFYSFIGFSLYLDIFLNVIGFVRVPEKRSVPFVESTSLLLLIINKGSGSLTINIHGLKLVNLEDTAIHLQGNKHKKVKHDYSPHVSCKF